MCGICGRLESDRARPAESDLVRRMTRRLQHRGPDGSGVFVSGPVALGHTRLSIIDLNTGGQPIANEDETVWIVYNGEVYNFPELRAGLVRRGHRFRSTTDTEVIVHLYEELGVDCVKQLRGMFAFAIWDERRQALFCARDRVGIKPFYYCETGTGLVFGSEIKALLCDPAVPRDVDPLAIDDFLSFSYVPGERTLFRAIRKLPPGHVLWAQDGTVTRRQYWDLAFPSAPVELSFADACRELRTRVQTTVREHMIADVPVGVLLSGGVDSTVVLGCAAQETSRRMQTFTVGFDGADFADERPFARLAAEQFGAEQHAITLTPQDFSGFLTRYVWQMEEPVYEPPAVALHFVSELARRHVKVVLSGEGGDEAFGGYHNYRNLLWLEGLKRGLGSRGSRLLSGALGPASRLPGLARLAKYAPLLRTPLSSYYYSRRSTPFTHFASVRSELYTGEQLHRCHAHRPGALVDRLFATVRDTGPLSQMLYVDTKTWLPDDLLVKADKMTMANSLELRVPLLDHALLEFAAALPPSYKVKGAETKRILKAAFADVIPPEIRHRKKVGFPVPVARWLRTDLREFVTGQLLDSRALGRGYFRRGAVERLLADCFAGRPRTTEVFSLLALELWHQRFVDSPPLDPVEPAPVPA